jgi:hypothetical protein
VLGTKTKRQNLALVEARVAWEVKGWLEDGVTQLWAQAIEEGMKGGDGSSSEMRGGHAGVSADVEEQETASEGKSRHQEENRATHGEGEQEVEAAHCTAAAGGMHCSGGRTEQWSSRAQRKEKRGGKRSRTQV